MVLRFLLRYFSSNEQLVQRLSESYPVRRAAKFVAYMYSRGRGIAEDSGLHKEITAAKLKDLAQKFSQNVRTEIENVKDEIKKRK